DVLVPDEVVDAVRGGRDERRDDPAGEILDVDEAPRLRAVTRNCEGLPCERLRGEGGNDRGRTRAWPVGDTEAQDGVLEPVQLAVAGGVHLARDLRGCVEVPREGER